MGAHSPFPPLFAEAVQCFQRGDLDGAERRCKRLIEGNPQFPPSFDLLGNIHLRRGAFAEAEAAFEGALRIDSANPEFRVNLATAQSRRGLFQEAAANTRLVLTRFAGHARALSVLGPALRNLKKYDEAVECGKATVAAVPQFAPAHAELGAALAGAERYEEALGCYERALALAPDFAEAWCAKGRVLFALKRESDAEKAMREALRCKPDLVPAHMGLGEFLAAMGRHDDAAAHFRRAVEIQPANADAACALGAELQAAFRIEAATEAYRHALAVDPDLVAALVGLGRVHLEAGRDHEAVPLLERAYRLSPDEGGILDMLVLARLQLCAWDGLEPLRAALLERIRADRMVVNPFVAILADADSAHQDLAARQWARIVTPADAPLFRHVPPEPEPGRRLRIGYMSSDLHDHPLAHLMVGIFENHDRARFEMRAYSLGYDDGSPMRRRIAACFDEVVQIDQMGGAEAARRIQTDGIDILVDLNGYTNHGNPAVLAYRPAPIQVNFQGYAATLGADFMDYIIGDPVTLPLSEQPHFAEAIVQMPYSYHPGTVTRSMAESVPKRSDFGLPEAGFVFCCFNNAGKFTPEVFAVWMRLLKAVPDSVLWLLDRNGTVKDNILAQVDAHGVDRGRVVLAPRVPLPLHLARQQLADLFLDTLPYNAHVTASDALWAGLPLLTCLGHAFAGRVAGSLLKVLELDELITTDLEQYEARALELARDRGRLDGLRARLMANKASSPLFDVALYTRHLEAAYASMWERWCAGRAPEPFVITP
ncbi:TPR domain protein putative component of TonB system [Paramagnetospirillum magnetotacticum MS-1]|uniref:protein O-GlcNAc transferase n=1 Tax=Paramagnetospirillum magnetotacticum MS-1 TaxID=272627 RepID=A0A0C2YFU2_PARME|nr:glycosyltransferase family 41 protein [Paramagnetospirillum magnetotacticum]KIL98584.1 TPR domain protein putative component of TonB system [Paramagnetospirillum magnetotacticum MS-1]